MNLAQLLPLALQASMGLIVFSVALHARDGDVTYLLRRPSLLVRSLVAMNVVMPFLAAAIAAACELRPELEVSLILLAVSPVPPILPNKEIKAGGEASYAIGLLALTSLTAIVFVPASVAILGRVLGKVARVPTADIALAVATSVLVPLVLGVVVRRAAPAFAQRCAKPASIGGTALLVLVFIPILAASWHGLVGEIGSFTLGAIVLFALASVVVGHVLGGPEPSDRTVLALSTASRHPGVALAAAHAIAPQAKAVSAAVLLCFLVSSVATIPYVKWRKRPVDPPAAPMR